jgi:hypothetical protein
VCRTLEIGLLHVHHLRDNSVALRDVATVLGIPYVMTLHDYYVVCPMYTLLDPCGQPCGACLGTDGGSPDACMRSMGEPPEFLAAFQETMHGFLTGAQRLFVPNVRARDIIGKRYPDLLPRIAVSEHGHHRPPDTDDDSRAGPSDELHVAVIGGLEVHKGARLLRAILCGNRRNDLVFHLYGTTCDPEIAALSPGAESQVEGSRFIYHGAYDAKDIVQELRRGRIGVGLQLSIWPETFSYTLSEFAQAGVPVIAGDIGAQGERTERCALGWTVPASDAGAYLNTLDSLAGEPVRLNLARARMRADEALRPMSEMWADYGATYRTLAKKVGLTMRDNDGEPAAVAEKEYVKFLAMRVAEDNELLALARERQHQLERQVASLQELLRSPRHRVATMAAGALQKVPVIWPAIARVTAALVKRRSAVPTERSPLPLPDSENRHRD